MAKEKSKKWYLRWWMFAIYFLAFLILITSPSGNGEKNEISQEQIQVKEETLTQSIQAALDKAFEGTGIEYRVEVEIGSIESYGMVGWLNIYPLNAQSWNLLPLSQKKDFVATLINISRTEISKNLGRVYIRNNVRILAEGHWDAIKGDIIEIK